LSNLFFTIQSGSLKGRKIPIPNQINGHSNFTPAILKKAIFSILDSLDKSNQFIKKNTIFFDLFSASGQIGIEAISQGFQKSILFEIDRQRFTLLKKNFSNYESLQIFNKDAFRYFDSIEIQKKDSIIFFLDPPYFFWEKNFQKLESFIESLKKTYPEHNKLILIQTPDKIHLNDFTIRKIGNQNLAKLFIQNMST
jgi:16S rRNA G966 N2-methylase RsmD